MTESSQSWNGLQLYSSIMWPSRSCNLYTFSHIETRCLTGLKLFHDAFSVHVDSMKLTTNFSFFFFDFHVIGAGLHGGRGVFEIDAAENARPDADVQPERGHLPARRPAVSHVPRRRHAKVTHHRCSHSRPNDPLTSHGRRWTDALLPARTQGQLPPRAFSSDLHCFQFS